VLIKSWVKSKEERAQGIMQLGHSKVLSWNGLLKVFCGNLELAGEIANLNTPSEKETKI
jgi:hypothetical protein